MHAFNNKFELSPSCRNICNKWIKKPCKFEKSALNLKSKYFKKTFDILSTCIHFRRKLQVGQLCSKHEKIKHISMNEKNRNPSIKFIKNKF